MPISPPRRTITVSRGGFESVELKGKAPLFRRRKLLRLFNIIWQSKGDGFVSVAFQLAVLAIGLGARLKCSLLFRI